MVYFLCFQKLFEFPNEWLTKDKPCSPTAVPANVFAEPAGRVDTKPADAPINGIPISKPVPPLMSPFRFFLYILVLSYSVFFPYRIHKPDSNS